MLILDGVSENKLTELVKVSEELNETLREYYPGVHKIIPDRAALIWCEYQKRSRTDCTTESLQ